MPARLVQAALQRLPLVLHRLKPAGQSTNEAMKMLVSFPDPRRLGERLTVSVKWKEAPRGTLDAANNCPRRELAAYAFQQLFLDEADFVVPPTVARCLDLRRYRRLRASARPTLDGLRCALGVMAYWLQGTTGQNVYSPARFRHQPAYRHHLANFNLFTHLIDHRDSRMANWKVATDPHHPRVFSIDNGLAFGSFWKNPFPRLDWGRLFVPGVPRRSVARLRRLDLRALRQRLAVVAQFRLQQGRLFPTPLTPPLDRDRGVRRTRAVLQLGLTDSEIRATKERIRRLLGRVDRGEISLFH
jgi:hypothetical protein